MAKVHERTARKDYPASGIKKGDRYFTWKTRTTVGKSYMGTVHRSLTPPKTTSTSDWEIALAGISFEGVEDSDQLRSIAEEVRDLGQEQQDKFDNMPEGLQQGEVGELLEQRATDCGEWADAIEAAADAYDEEAETLEKVFDDDNVNAWDAYHDEDMADDVEPELDDPTDRDHDAELADLLSEKVAEAESACPF